MTDFTSSDRGRRIARLSAVMAVLCLIAAAALPVILGIYAFAFSGNLARNAAVVGLEVDPELVTPPVAAAAFAVMLAAAAPAIWAFLELRALFRRYAKGEVFSAPAARHLRRFATALIAAAAVRPVTSALMSLVLTSAKPEPGGQIAVSIGSDDVGLALLGVAILVIAWVMAEAVALADENKSFV